MDEAGAADRGRGGRKQGHAKGFSVCDRGQSAEEVGSFEILEVRLVNCFGEQRIMKRPGTNLRLMRP